MKVKDFNQVSSVQLLDQEITLLELRFILWMKPRLNVNLYKANKQVGLLLGAFIEYILRARKLERLRS